MGLDGYVRCRCWQDGKVTPPAEFVGLVVVDSDGDLDLSIPYRGNEETHHAFSWWVHESACPHEDMDFASEWVGNWAAYRALQHALAVLGWHRFPTLHAGLPDANGGSLASADAPAALAELRDFARCTDIHDQALLCDADTGEVVWEQIYAFGGGNVMNYRTEMGVDLDGFYIRRRGVGGEGELFRAARFTQDVLHSGSGVRFTDGVREVTLPVDPVQGDSGGTPHRLELRLRRRGGESYPVPVNALTRLFEASIQTGNPVMWC